MRRLLLLAAVSAVALARPELYKEKEDFQYSRSSSDEGTKSGYYGAQRGNMGRNYEKAHNMDGVAQRTMSSAVKNVQGELGDATRQRVGEVHTAGDIRGSYGDGLISNPDLTNLEGRNFQEGVTHDSHSALSSMNSDHTAHSAYSGGSASYKSQNSKYTGQRLVGAYIRPAGYENSGYHNGYGSQIDQNKYDANSEYNFKKTSGQTANYYGSRLVGAAPARVILRPGTVVTVPIAAETYDRNVASAYNQNAITSDTEVFANQHSVPVPTTKSKSYESSYRYSKEWEKHDSSPGAVPLAVPTIAYPQNSELYEDVRNEGHEQSANEQHSSYNSARSDSRYQSGYRQQQTKSSGIGVSNDRQYDNMGANNNAMDRITALSDKPKSYQSSYSYHKSWERQGDPYVIKPAQDISYDNQASQRLTSDSTKSHRYGTKSSHASYSQSALDCDCDEEEHLRQRRSYNQQQTQSELANIEDMGQQTQTNSEQLEDLGQQTQTKWDNLEDLDQQTQDIGQQTQDLSQQTQDLGQQTQDLGQLSQDFGQQTQDLGQQTQDLGQQSQNQWQDLSSFRHYRTQNKFDKSIEQHTQGKEQDTMHVSLDRPNNKLQNDKEINSNLDHFNQQPNKKQDQADNQMIQNAEQKSEDLGQETQNVWVNLETLDQHGSLHKSNKHEDNIGLDDTQQMQHHWDHYSQSDEQLTQQSDNAWLNEDKLKPGSYVNRDRIIPVWEDTGYTQQTIRQNDGAQHSVNTQHSDSSYFNSRTTSIPQASNDRGSVSLQQLWDKIDTISQQSSTDTDSDKNPSWYSHYNNQGFQNTYWKQRDEEFNNYFRTRNHTRSSSGGQSTWQDKKLENNNGSSSEREEDSSTGIVDQSDIGRGDIGVETMKTATERDSSKYFTGNTTTSKDLSDISYKPKHKTPAEIEALSQTKEIRETQNNKTINQQEDSNDGTVVLGLNKQWIDDKRNHNIESNINTPSGKIENTYNSGHRATTSFDSVQNSYNRNNKNEHEIQNQSINQRPEFMDDIQQNTEQKSEVIPADINLEQQSQTSLDENFEQQSFLSHELNDFSGKRDDFYERRYSTENLPHNTNNNSARPLSENQHLNKHDNNHKLVVPESPENIQHSVEQQTDFGQETMNLEQQSQSLFGENLEDMGQVQQQHADITQQIAEFDSMNKHDDFYEQKYHYMPQERSPQIVNSPTHQSPKSQVEVVTPLEINTEKPGFWKSVGNKFVGAKDTVKSWFSSSK